MNCACGEKLPDMVHPEEGFELKCVRCSRYWIATWITVAEERVFTWESR